MKRLQLSVGTFFTKSKDAAISSEASAAIVQVLKIASTINVPFCQTACNAVIAFIQMGEAAGTNDRQWKMLLDLIGIYAGQISEFVTTISEGQPSNYIVVSNDLRAKIAREAVKDFETNISHTKDKINIRLGNGRIRKRLAATVIQEEIAECRQLIANARDQFTGRVLNILTIASTQAPMSSMPLAPEAPEYDIPGARPLRGQDIEILEDIEIATLVQDSFWTNLVRVEVHGKVRIAKIYGPSNGGKAKFEKDLDFLTNHWTPTMVRVLGYNSRSQLPFVVFTSASVQPIVYFWSNFWRAIDKEEGRGPVRITFYGLGPQIERVTDYLFKHIDRRNVLELMKLYVALRDATVDLDGRLLVAPLTHDPLLESKTSVYRIAAGDNGMENLAPPKTLDSLEKPHPGSNLHPRRGQAWFNASKPFHAQDQLVRTWLAGKNILASLYQRLPYSCEPGLGVLASQPASLGDVVKFGLNGNQVVANVAGLAGSMRFYPPGKPTARMHVYRYDYNTFRGERSEGVKDPLCIIWFSDLDSNRVAELHQLCRRVRHDALGRRGLESGGPDLDSGLRPFFERISFFAVVTAVQHFIRFKDYPIRSLTQPPPGPTPNLYLYFSPQNEYISARWSFQPEPPSEAEALKEASLLSAYPCPEISSQPISGIAEYLCFDGEFDNIEARLSGRLDRNRW